MFGNLSDIERYAVALELPSLTTEHVQLGGVTRLHFERVLPNGRVRHLLIHWVGDVQGLPADAYAISGGEYGGDLETSIDGKHWGGMPNTREVVRRWLGALTDSWNELPR